MHNNSGLDFKVGIDHLVYNFIHILIASTSDPVQELAACLQHKLIKSSSSSINTTYDGNEIDFPVDRPILMYMSHDIIIVSVLTALGLDHFKYNSQGMPPTVAQELRRNFKLNEMTSFGARLIFEIWTCPRDDSLKDLRTQLYKSPDLSSSKNETVDYIHLVPNEAPLPLDGLSACKDSVNGFCNVRNFLSQVSDLTKEAQYQQTCFGKYNASTPVGNGQPPSFKIWSHCLVI
ncbi:hypothetical protein N7481_000291 [Penicillium waksmanii]|uniref:uncharacterized protein n=1 Tax=Penicillium waksmanii TaxID=69791 RepID=UPI002549AA70|nr:uncharacterized protein N7481_000291 [Penicillium waksmanii]KAJ5999882.1 hypothetical protein N7481_000291 [Penicillium waksmanii]